MLQLEQYQSLLTLSKSDNLINGNFKAFIEESIRMLTTELQASRASYWSYDNKHQLIKNEFLYDTDFNKFQSGEKLYKKDFPKYFKAFNEELCILADDAETDYRTSEFKTVYLDKHNIKSMLDVQVSVQGRLFGVICIEQTGDKRIWKKKEEFFASSVASYISQAYLTKLKNQEVLKRKKSEINYQVLFSDSPIPMWVYHPKTLYFLAVNKAAVKKYGYSASEFLKLKLYDIRPKSEIKKFKAYIVDSNKNEWGKNVWKHQLKNGELIDVEIYSDSTWYKDIKARIVLAMDVTKEKRLIQEQRESLNKLKDFAFYTSHNLRGPIANLLGLNSLLEHEIKEGANITDTVKNIHKSVNEVDQVIKVMNAKLH